ncbi:hypothetical protein KR044_000321, partial [Drosophila immigrans]
SSEGAAEKTEVEMGDESNAEAVSTREAYFASLDEWARQADDWKRFVDFLNSSYSIYLNNHLVMQRSRRLTGTSQLREAQHRIALRTVAELDGLPRQRLIWGLGGVEMLVAPFWKRALAEIIDTFIIVMLKVLVAFIFTSFAIIDLKKPIVHISLLEEDIVFSLLDVLRKFLQLSNATICMIVMMKVLTCCYEFLFLMCNHGMTPGKFLIGIRVVYVRTLIPVHPRPAPDFMFQVHSEPYYALVYPAITPNAVRILMRVLLKNFIAHCSFPFYLLLLFPRDNRTTYEMMSKTAVVEVRSERRPTAVRIEARRRR